MPGDRVKPLILRAINPATFTGSYQAINPLGCEGACNYIVINNYSNVAIYLSYDGVNDHGFILPDSSLIVSVQMNSQPSNQKNLFQKGMIVWVKGAAGVGTVNLSGFYQ